MDRRGAPRKTIDKVAIGKRIAIARKQAGLTQEELAEKVGKKSVKSISDWERGVSTPTKETINKIAKVCRVSFESIFTENDELILEHGKTIQHSLQILNSFDPVEYELNQAMKKAMNSVEWGNESFTASDLNRFQSYMEASIKNSIEFFLNNLMDTKKRKDDK